MMTRVSYLLVVTLVMGKAAVAGEIGIAKLGALSLDYERAIAVSSYPGQNIAAEVSFKKGEAYTLSAPRRIQQIKYLVEVGSIVEQGQPLAELRGPEMHHFLDEMEVARQLLLTAERRFSSNKKLFERQAIKEGQWAEVSEKYYAAELEYEHMRHFNDLVISTDEEQNMIVIGAPIAGVVDYAPDYHGVVADADLAIIVPGSAIRLEAAIPASRKTGLISLKSSSCELNISSISAIVSNFFVTAWSEPLNPQCDLMLGQTLMLTPVYETRAYAVPMTAVFQWQRLSSIFIRIGAGLQLVEVELIGSSGTNYIVSSDRALEDVEVLVSSVSAVQGILIGLGGE